VLPYAASVTHCLEREKIEVVKTEMYFYIVFYVCLVILNVFVWFM